jgi:hypothetical protein
MVGWECSVGDTGESGAECLEHSFDFRNSLSDYYQPLGRIDVTFRLATEMPFNFYGNELLVQLGEFTAQDFREAFSLGTFRGLCHGCRCRVRVLAG